MSSTLLLDLLRDLIVFLLNTITTLVSAIHHSERQLKQGETIQEERARLQVARSALVLQQADITRRIDDIDVAIQQLNQRYSAVQSDPPPPSNTPLQQSTNLQSVPTPSTPPNVRSRIQHRVSSIGRPYPLPYTPPRTPEEQRRNNIINWVNEMRKRNNT